MVQDIRMMVELIYKFFKTFRGRLEEIKEIARKCEALDDFSADRIAHFVLGYN